MRRFDDEDDYDLDGYDDEPSRGRLVLHGLVIALQSILAVAFGAGLFLAFDQLWQWNSMVAMVLAILATLGLVAGVWVVRKTEDIASTLIAVGVGPVGHLRPAGPHACELDLARASRDQGRTFDGLGLSATDRGGFRVRGPAGL